MKQINLNSTIRTQIGGNSAKRYRKSGQIPAVIYGESGEKNLLIEEKSLVAALKQVAGKAVLIELAFSDGTESRYAMIKDTARNPLSGAGVLEIHEHEVRVKCRPRDLPELIEIDVSELKVGEAIHLKDVKAPEGVEFESDLEDVLCTCNLVKEEPEAEPAAAAPAEGEAAPAADAAAKEAAPAKK